MLGAIRALAERRDRLRRRRQQRDRHLYRVRRRCRGAALGRRGRRRGLESGRRGIAGCRKRRRAARLALVRTPERRRAGARDALDRAPDSTIQASVPSTRISNDSGRAGVRAERHRRCGARSLSRRSLDARASCRRSKARTRSRSRARLAAERDRDDLILVNLSGRGDKDIATMLAALFERARREGRVALIPYVMAGDPDLETTEAILLALTSAGADLIELGIPYSDPLADGPAIAAAHQRALRAGTRLADVFALARRCRDRSCAPIVFFTYFNPVYPLRRAAFRARSRRGGRRGSDRSGPRARGDG